MFELYIFDIGGVVSRNTNVVPKISAHLDFNRTDMVEYGREDFRALTTGAITEQEFIRRFSAKSGTPMEEDLLTRFFDPELDPEVIATIRRLKNGARAVAGTNTIESHFNIHLQRRHYEVFDAVYASHLMGLAKPDALFYSHILQQESCPPEKAVFIDDLEANVKAARKLGIHSILFKDAKRLNQELASLPSN